MAKWKLFLRITPLFLILGLFLMGATARLYNLQITHGEINQMQAEKRMARTVSVPAARGEMLDRFGRPLVTNHVSYNLRIDLSKLELSSEPNDVIDRLTRLMRSQDVPYEDNFPVVAGPYRFKMNLSEQDKLYMEQFVGKLKWPENMTAPELMEKLIELFKISDSYDEEAVRRIAAVRYELELRKVFQYGEEPYYYIPDYQFADDVDISLVAMICEQEFPGVVVDTAPVREYKTHFAAHLLGRVGKIPASQADEYREKGYAADELVGLDGLEYGLETWLRGKAGTREEETNAAGKVTGIISAQAPEPGKNCLLTIDIRLQEQVEHALELGVLELRERGKKDRLPEADLAGSGAAVLMEVKTGEIIAMASYPTFDLIHFWENYAELNEDPVSPMLNRAIAGTYEPGSTFKMATAIAALESGAISTRETIRDLGRYMRYAPSYTPRCTGAHGSVSVAGALKVSCNYFFYEVGYRTGIDVMNEYARKLGFGALSGVELPGEKAGILAGRDYCEEKGILWNPGDVLQAAIGQSYNQFTPLQLCGYVATLANGGVRCRPHLLKSVKSYDYAETVYEEQPEVVESLELKDGTLEAILTGMRLVCQAGGTAAATFATFEPPVAAKTGSAQTTANGRPANGVFVAFAPFDNPEVAIAVVVERGGAGSRVAPIARDILEAYFMNQNAMNNIMPENQLHG